MAGDGLMANDEFQAELIESGVQGIHILVAQDHGIGQLAVAPEKRMQGAGQRLFVQSHHFQQLGADQIDVLLKHGLQMRLRRRGQTMASLSE